MATIYSRETATGETQWSAMIRLRGRPTEHKTFPNKTLAKQWAQRREADLRQGRDLLRREAERHTLGELVEVYVEEIAGQGRRRQYLKRQASQLRWWVEQLGYHRDCIYWLCRRRGSNPQARRREILSLEITLTLQSCPLRVSNLSD